MSKTWLSVQIPKVKESRTKWKTTNTFSFVIISYTPFCRSMNYTTLSQNQLIMEKKKKKKHSSILRYPSTSHTASLFLEQSWGAELWYPNTFHYFNYFNYMPNTKIASFLIFNFIFNAVIANQAPTRFTNTWRSHAKRLMKKMLLSLQRGTPLTSTWRYITPLSFDVGSRGKERD